MLDNGITVRWSKVSGPGNVTFTNPRKLETKASFSQAGLYKLKIQIEDSKTQASNTIEIAVQGEDNNPPVLTVELPDNTVAENKDKGTQVGIFSTKGFKAPVKVELVSGSGSANNGVFKIKDNALLTDQVFDYETKSTYTIRVRVSDDASNTFESKFTINITNDTSEAAPKSTLSSNTVKENKDKGTQVGTFSTKGFKAPVKVELVSGSGSANNGAFKIKDSALLTDQVFDYETKSTYTIRARVSDDASNTFESKFTINITNDTSEAAPKSTLSSNTVKENKDKGTQVGTFSTKGFKAPVKVELVSGSGSANNGAFKIKDNALLTDQVFDYETKSTYTIRVRVSDDASNTFESKFTINITNDTSEAAPKSTLSSNTVKENKDKGTQVGTFSTKGFKAPVKVELVSGSGSANNGVFKIKDNALLTDQVFDYETKSTYTIRARVSDDASNTFESKFTINITNDTSEAAPKSTLSSNTVAENKDKGTQVGTFSTKGFKAPVKVELVSGSGSANNGVFKIKDNALLTDQVFNYETKSTYTIRARVSDDASNTFESKFTINITNDTSEPAPKSTLSSNTVKENKDKGTQVGTFSTNGFKSPVKVELVSGSGSANNGAFKIKDNALLTDQVFDYETKSTYTIRARVSDDASNTFEGKFTINITNDTSEAAPKSTLSSNTVKENKDKGTQVGTFSTKGFKAPVKVELVSGSGSANNGVFKIKDNALLTDQVFDYETKSTYTIRARVSDDASNTFESKFTINITNDTSEPAPKSTLSSNSVAENKDKGTQVGIFSTKGFKAPVKVELVSGSGSANNGAFKIKDNALLTNQVFDYETKSTYTIRARVSDDASNTFESKFTINITNDTSEAAPKSTLSSNSVAENKDKGTQVGTFSTKGFKAPVKVELVSGSGSANNGAFKIKDNALLTEQVFDYETKSTYTIRAQVSDDASNTFESKFTINITNDTSEPAPKSTLSSNSVAENKDKGTQVGTFSTKGFKAPVKVELVSGSGSANNGAFKIKDNALLTDQVFDYETKSTYTIRARVSDDASNTFESKFTINITNDTSEAAPKSTLSSNTVSRKQRQRYPSGNFFHQGFQSTSESRTCQWKW